MKKHNQLLHKNAGLIGAICGSLLIGIPLSPLSGETKPIAQLTPNRIVPAGAPTTPATVLNPRPSIFNEPPYNRARASATAPSVSPAVPDQTNPPVQPPLPEERSQPISKVMPMNSLVNVRLKNNTNAPVSYEAIGYTQRRFLPGGEETVLRNLPTPVTVTFVRQDKGLVDVIPTSTQQGALEVSLDESKNLDDNQGVLRIQRDGQVFLN